MRLPLLVLARVASAVLTLLGVSVVIFTAAHLLPGGYSDVILGPLSSPADRAAAAARYGLDDPLVVQYWHWLSAVLGGDLGTSLISRSAVSDEIASRLGVTVELAVVAVVLAAGAGITIGVLTALRSGASSSLGRLASGAGLSLPDFVLGSFLAYLFSRYSLGLTVGGYVPITDDLLRNLRAIALPALVLAVFATAVIARTTRDAVLGVLVEPHITAAVARGETPWFIVRHHVLRNASASVIVVTTTVAAQLLGGVVIVESLFNLQGIGLYIVQAVSRRDYAVVEACVLLAAMVFIVVNMTADLANAVVDPRLGTEPRR